MKTLDNKITFSMFIKGIGERLQSIMAKSLSAEEKLELIEKEMEKDANEKRVTARSIRAKMVALADPDTQDLEPIEKLNLRREKLVKLGKKANQEKKELEELKIAREINALDASLLSLKRTYETLKDAYDVALENFKTAQAAYEHVKNNGASILFAIRAHKEAIELKDNTRNDNKVDSSFLDDLQAELEKTQRELRSDEKIGEEVNSIQESVLDNEEKTEAEEKILNELRSN